MSDFEQLKASLGIQTPKAEPVKPEDEVRLYRADVVCTMSTKAIEAALAKAKATYDAEYAGKSFRAYYRQEAQLQALRRIEFWAQVLRHRHAGLV